MQSEASLVGVEREIYQGKLVRIGLFRCAPTHPYFSHAGQIRRHILVFPRTASCITHAGREPVVATPNVVMFYNTGQRYRRSKVSERGDHCEWFAFDPGVITDVLTPHDPWVQDRPERPFQFTHGPSDPATYLLQRRVVEYVLAEAQPDPLYVEETLLNVLARTVGDAYARRSPGSQVSPAQRELVREVQRLLATRYAERLSLDGLAAALHYSPFHLCKLFRQHTGLSIHKYLNQVRLRTGLEWLADGSASLTDVALNLGFSSHSHFTLAFRKAFGAPPSALRDIPVSHHLKKMHKNLIARQA